MDVDCAESDFSAETNAFKEKLKKYTKCETVRVGDITRLMFPTP